MHSIFGSIIRAPLRFIPKSLVIPIISGPLKGIRWIVGAGPHGCWLGSYEGRKPRQMASLIDVGDCVFDIGANSGYYTLLASRYVGRTGSVFSFEPLPHNLAILRDQIRLNGANNVTVVPAAVSDREGTARFSPGQSPLMGRLTATGEIEVETVTVDGIVQGGVARAPQVMKIDVEGSEELVLNGASDTLQRIRPIILLAGHSTAIQRRCVSILESHGYCVQESACGDGNYESLALPQ